MPRSLQIGIVGKPNVGKSTLFNALTLASVPVAPYPFTTIEPNVGIAYVSFACVCKELGVTDNPRNSFCINGIRFAPVEVVDTAGLVPSAWQGRGLGNEFLDKISRADVLIHVVDGSGSTDLEGRVVPPGTHDPLVDIEFLEEEIARWIYQIIKRHWEGIIKDVSIKQVKPTEAIYKRLTGLAIKLQHIEAALRETHLSEKSPESWRDDEVFKFAKTLRRIAKPIVIAVNKVDSPAAQENLERLKGRGIQFFPISAISEWILRRAAEKGIIKYVPGSGRFEITNSSVSSEQLRALELVEKRVLSTFGSTGVQELLNYCVFDLLGFVAVFPVEDVERFTDGLGNVLPDVFLMPRGSTALDLAAAVHSELAKGMLYAVDVRSKIRLPKNYTLKHRDVIKIVSPAKRG